MMKSGCDRSPRLERRCARSAPVAAGKVALQGNLDPSALFAPQKSVREAARRVLDAFGTALDTCSISATALLRKHPSMPFAALIDEVRTYSEFIGPDCCRHLTYSQVLLLAGISGAA